MFRPLSLSCLWWSVFWLASSFEVSSMTRIALPGSKPGSPSKPPTRKKAHMPKLTAAEREVLIAKTAVDMDWCVYVTDPVELPYYVGLAAKVGGRVVEHQGGKKIFLPVDSVLLSVRRKLNLSPEERAERARNMKVRSAGQAVTASTPT